MAVSLNPTLAAAQNQINRHPIVQVRSQKFADLLPLVGNDFGVTYDSKLHPSLLSHSSGRLGMTFSETRETSDCYGYYWYTDINREQWTEKLLYSIGDLNAYHCHMVEMPDESVGLVMWFPSGGANVVGASFDITGSSLPLGPTDWTTVAYMGGYVISASAAVNDAGTAIIVWSMWNGSTSSIWYSTTTDFSTFTGAIDITPPTLNTDYPIDQVNICNMTDGSMILAFAHGDAEYDGEYVYNIYTMTSTTNGLTWSNYTAQTSYDSLRVVGKHPIISQKTDGTVTLTYVRYTTYEFMNGGQSGWPTACGSVDDVRYVHYNPNNQRLYLAVGNTGSGAKGYCAVVIVDPATWTIERTYDSNSVPDLSALFAAATSWSSYHGSEDYYTFLMAGDHIAFIDDQVGTIATYHFYDNATYGVTANMSGFENTPVGSTHHLSAIYYDSVERKIWCVLTETYVYRGGMIVGWISIDQAPDIDGNYTFTPLSDGQYTVAGASYGTLHAEAILTGYKTIKAIPEKGWVTIGIYQENPSPYFEGEFHVYSITTGAVVKKYHYSLYSGFPFGGCWNQFYHNGYIYAAFTYYSGLAAEVDKKGMLRMNPDTDEFNYIVPPWAAGSHFYFRDAKVKSDDRVWLATTDGAVVYDLPADTWKLYDSDDIIGLPSDAGCNSVDYDSVSGSIFTGHWSERDGVYMFNENGYLRETLYATGSGGAGIWNYTGFDELIYGTTNLETVTAYDSSNVLWAVWSHYNSTGGVYHLYWDKLEADKNLTNDLTTDPVAIEWDVENTSTVSFTLSKGHLYDPQSQTSSLCVYVEKGRKITVKMGEKINGINYYQQQGIFYVTDTRVNYVKGQYPTITVTAEDGRYIWEDHRMITSIYYSNQTPKAIIEGLLNSHTWMDSGEYDIPTFDDTHNITHQFVDMYLIDAIRQIGDHFFYVMHFDTDGKATMLKVDLEKSVDHTYSDSKQTVEYSPDDSFSNMINKITVVGETDTFTLVVYQEELIETLTGTVGWWGGSTDLYVYYSKDLSRQCRQPRLYIQTSVAEFKYFVDGGGGNEYISYEDPNELYCIITLDCPDMVWVLVGAITNLLAAGALALWGCQFSVGAFAQWSPCGLFVFLISIWMSIISGLLATVANYSYEVYARPVGHEKMSVSGTAEDLELQAKLGGQIVAEVIDDPFCTNAGECERVAEGELAIIKAQRSRVQLKKIAHLQDELLDMIALPHPYSEHQMQLLITKLRRELVFPGNENISTEAGIFDTIEGWRI